MEHASEVIYQLNPVSFRYKPEIEPGRPASFGLIAEEVETVHPDLVLRDQEGRPYTVRYDQVNAMLLNEFLKDHRKVQQQEETITQLKSTVAQQKKAFETTAAQQEKEIKSLTASLKEQAAQIQKVSARLEAGKPALQVVAKQ